MPVVIATGFTGTSQPLNHPRVGWRRLSGAVTTTNEAEGFEAINADNERTDSFWRPTALPSSWIMSFGDTFPVSYCGIASHTLGSTGCTVEVGRIGASFSFVTIAEATPTNDDPLFFLFPRQNRSSLRIRVSGGADMPLLGVVWFGDVTEWPRPAVYAPSVSFQRAKRSAFATNETEGGKFVGRRRIRQELRPAMEVEHLSESWITSEFDAFARHAETLPFFIADRPGDYPASVAFAWADSDLIPERSYPKATIANRVSMELRAERAT